MHDAIEEYPNWLDDMDDFNMVEYDSFERLKPFDPVPGSTVGASNPIPPEDNDTIL